MKKYELTDEVGIVGGKLHYRIRALVDIPYYHIHKGDLGGWVSGEHNLSHDGDCWVAEDAVVSDKAIVSGNAYICGQAKVLDSARVTEDAVVSDKAIVSGNAYICGQAKVLDSARVTHFARIQGQSLVEEKARISGWAYIADRTQISGSACIMDYAYVCDDARIFGYTRVTGDAHVYEESVIRDEAHVGGTARILGSSIIKDTACVFGAGRIKDSIVGGNAWIDGDVSLIDGVIVDGKISLTASFTLSADKHPIHLKHDKDIYVFKNTWSSGRTFCYIPKYKRWHVGCFIGTGDELIKKAYADSKLSGDMYFSYVKLVDTLESERRERD